MKTTIRKITALTLAVMTFGASVSCGKSNEDINDSQESSSAENNEGEKKKVKLAILEGSSDFSDTVRWYNIANSSSEIEIVNYGLMAQQSEEGYYSDAFNALKMDIISGADIDMVRLSSENMYPLVSNGYLTDLYKVMEEAGALKREDFLPNVLEGLEFEGELPAICESFYVHTAAAKSSNISDSQADWTVEEAADFYYSLSDDTDLLYKIWDSDALWVGNTLDNYMMRKIVRDSVDLPNGKCSFGDSFIKSVEFLEGKDFTASNLSIDMNSEIDEVQWSLINDKAMLNCVTITGFNSYLSQEICRVFGGEDITFVGYPSESGNGAITDAAAMYGILGNSDAKNEAWAFIENQLNSPQCIPVITEKLEESAKNENTQGQTSLRKPQQLPYPEQDTEITISDETVQKTLDYIKSVEFSPYHSDEVESIICEEYQAVLAGEKSIDECIEILNSRISIYLAEKQ